MIDVPRVWLGARAQHLYYFRRVDRREGVAKEPTRLSYLFLEHEFSFTNASTFYVSAISQNAYFFGTELRSLLEVTLIYQEGHEIGL